jgi:hypothetical protein
MTLMTRRETPVDVAQKLVSYLDSSNGEIQPLFDAVEALRHGPKERDAPFDLDAFEEHVEALNAALDEAWAVLEEDDGETPLMSEQYISWSGDTGDEAEFIGGSGASSLVQTISDALDVALAELDDARLVVRAGSDVPVSDLAGDYGAYDSLSDYLDYVYSQVKGMCEFATRLEREV